MAYMTLAACTTWARSNTRATSRYSTSFDQSGGEWTLQAKKLDLNIFGVTILPAQAHVAVAILILVYVPLFNYFHYPAINRFFPLTPIRKMGIGLFLTGASFVVIWWLQTRIEAGDRPTVWWQFFAYLFFNRRRSHGLGNWS
jgi:proton-dependent oligopeptide transporter, POT family